MSLFRKIRKAIIKLKVHKSSPEVTASKEYLKKTHPTLIRRDFIIAKLCGNAPFNYLRCSQHVEYIKYHFCEGLDKRIIQIVLCPEEQEKKFNYLKK